MKSYSRLSLAAIAFFGSSYIVHGQTTPYLETAPLTILWSFADTGIAGTTLGPVPVIPGVDASIDPESLRPVDRITTDVGKPIAFTLGAGDQAFFVRQCLRIVAERFANDYKILATAVFNETADPRRRLDEATKRKTALEAKLETTTDEAERDSLNEQIAEIESELISINQEISDIIGEERSALLAAWENEIQYLIFHNTDRWELTSVREPSATVNELLDKPIHIYLTRIERTMVGVSRNYDTGLLITPLGSAQNSVETLNAEGGLVRASGNATTHFSLEFESFYADDPLHLIKAENRVKSIAGKDYNTTGISWLAFGSGYMSHGIRSTPGSLPAVAPTKIKITGHGSWGSIRITTTRSDSFSGLAPLSIKMGEIKYQNRNMFSPYVTVEPEESE